MNAESNGERAAPPSDDDRSAKRLAGYPPVAFDDRRGCTGEAMVRRCCTVGMRETDSVDSGADSPDPSWTDGGKAVASPAGPQRFSQVGAQKVGGSQKWSCLLASPPLGVGRSRYAGRPTGGPPVSSGGG